MSIELKSTNFKWGCIWDECVVSHVLGNYLLPKEMILLVGAVNRQWRRSTKNSDRLWQRYATNDFLLSSGPFAQLDEEKVGYILARRMSHFAFLPPYSSDPHIWSDDPNKWTLTPNGRFFDLYHDFFHAWKCYESHITKMVNPVLQLRKEMNESWSSWQQVGRKCFILFVTLVLIIQSILIPIALDARIRIAYVEQIPPENPQLPIQYVAYNERVERPEPCENNWQLCLPWSIILLPLWCLTLVSIMVLGLISRFYCRKQELRRRFFPLFRKQHTITNLRKIAIAEFPHDLPVPIPIPQRAERPSVLLNNNNNNNNNINNALGNHDEFDSRSRLMGYRLISKLICGILCLLSIVSFGLWLDGYWNPGWLTTVWLYPCPLITPMVLPRSEWTKRWLSIVMLSGFWYSLCILASLQLSQSIPPIGLWVYFVIVLPILLSIGIFFDPTCDIDAVRQSEQPRTGNESREVISVICGLTSLATFWVAGFLMTGRAQAFMQFNFVYAAIPLWIALASLSISSLLNPQ